MAASSGGRAYTSWKHCCEHARSKRRSRFNGSSERDRAELGQKLTRSVLERQIANSPPPVTVTPRPKTPPDMDFYITISENAKKRAEALERENLEVGSTRVVQKV